LNSAERPCRRAGRGRRRGKRRGRLRCRCRRFLSRRLRGVQSEAANPVGQIADAFFRPCLLAPQIVRTPAVFLRHVAGELSMPRGRGDDVATVLFICDVRPACRLVVPPCQVTGEVEGSHVGAGSTADRAETCRRALARPTAPRPLQVAGGASLAQVSLAHLTSTPLLGQPACNSARSPSARLCCTSNTTPRYACGVPWPDGPTFALQEDDRRRPRASFVRALGVVGVLRGPIPITRWTASPAQPFRRPCGPRRRDLHWAEGVAGVAAPPRRLGAFALAPRPCRTDFVVWNLAILTEA